MIPTNKSGGDVANTSELNRSSNLCSQRIEESEETNEGKLTLENALVLFSFEVVVLKLKFFELLISKVLVSESKCSESYCCELLDEDVI